MLFFIFCKLYKNTQFHTGLLMIGKGIFLFLEGRREYCPSSMKSTSKMTIHYFIFFTPTNLTICIYKHSDVVAICSRLLWTNVPICQITDCTWENDIHLTLLRTKQKKKLCRSIKQTSNLILNQKKLHKLKECNIYHKLRLYARCVPLHNPGPCVI